MSWIAFLAGLVLVPLLPAHQWLSVFLPFAVGLALILGTALRFKRGPRCVLALALGACVSHVGVQLVVASQLDSRWHGRDIAIVAEVASVTPDSRLTRLEVQVRQTETDALAHMLPNRRLRLSWYRGPAMKPGDVWHLTVRLKPPRGFVNPWGFDYQAWLLNQGFVATGYVREGELQRRVRDGGAGIGGIRHALDDKLFGGAASLARPFLRALLLGDKSDITHAQWEVLKRTGTIHLMAISGLHVGLVAALGFALAIPLSRLLALLPSPYTSGLPARCGPPLMSVAAAFGYSALAGFSIPTQRAVTVVTLVNLAFIAGLRPSPSRLLIIAAIVVLIGSPLASTQTGFWLSFGAVAVLLAGFGGRQRPGRHGFIRYLPGLIQVQCLLAVGLLAPLLALGQTVSAVGLPANLLAVPAVSLLVVPGLLIAALLLPLSPEASRLLIHGVDWLFGILWHYLEALAVLPWAEWWPSLPLSVGLLGALALAAVLILAPAGVGFRALGLMLMPALLLVPRPAPSALQLTVLDVGQGLAVWARTPHHNVLFDAGPRFGGGFDAGSRIVVPYLRSQGIHRLDRMIVSHGDTDHSGGAAGVLETLSAGRVLVGEPANGELFATVEPCKRGQRWQYDDVRFEVLWPPAGPLARERYKSNNRSCVLLLKWRGTRILLMGDVEDAVERRLLRFGVPAPVDVLVAPHHGSHSSSSRALVTHLEPRHVVFSAGYRNRFGHPHPTVVKRYKSVGARIYNTGRDGALTFVWERGGDAPDVTAARAAIDRAWY